MSQECRELRCYNCEVLLGDDEGNHILDFVVTDETPELCVPCYFESFSQSPSLKRVNRLSPRVDSPGDDPRTNEEFSSFMRGDA